MEGSENGHGDIKQKVVEEGKLIITVTVQSGKELNEDSINHLEISSSSSDEESKPVENSQENEVGKLLDGVVVTDPIVVLVEKEVSEAEEVMQVVEAAPEEVPKATDIIEASPKEIPTTTDVVEASTVEKDEVIQVAETEHGENSGVLEIVEAAGVENSKVVGGVDFPSVEVKEKLTVSETVSEKPRESGEFHNENENPEPQTVSALPPVRRTSWMNCCGLFELLKGSHR